MFTQALDSQIIRMRRLLRRRRANQLRSIAMAKPFSENSKSRLLIVSQSDRIQQSQIFAFHHFAADFDRLFGCEIREADLDAVMVGAPVAATGATVVAFQTHSTFQTVICTG